MFRKNKPPSLRTPVRVLPTGPLPRLSGPLPVYPPVVLGDRQCLETTVTGVIMTREGCGMGTSIFPFVGFNLERWDKISSDQRYPSTKQTRQSIFGGPQTLGLRGLSSLKRRSAEGVSTVRRYPSSSPPSNFTPTSAGERRCLLSAEGDCPFVGGPKG